MPYIMGNAPVFMIDGHQVLCDPDQYFVPDILVRNAVVVLFEGDMVINMHFGLLDFNVFKGMLRLQNSILYQTFVPFIPNSE